jgi:hypothetical protein
MAIAPQQGGRGDPNPALSRKVIGAAKSSKNPIGES